MASFFRLLFDISKVSCREYEGHPDYDMEYDEHLVYDFDKMVLSIHRVNYESEGLTIGYWDGPTVDVRELIDWNEYRDELEKYAKDEDVEVEWDNSNEALRPLEDSEFDYVCG